MNNMLKTGRIIGDVSIIILFIFGILIFLFALVSGCEEYGGGFSGILKNSPNALPWLLLLVLAGVARKWQFTGGILITLIGIGLLYFFGIFDSEYQTATLIIALFPVILGSLLILRVLLPI